MTTILKVDPEFKTLIPPLTQTEFDQLRDNILAEGIRDALVTWRGILLDGHNRYTIAQDYGLSFQTAELDLPDHAAALLWIVKNQLGRRNLTPQESRYLRGKWYNEEKQDQHRPEKGDQFDPLNPQKTADRIAAQTGVSAPTVKRDAEYATAIDKIAAAAGNDARRSILSSEVRMTNKEVIQAADLIDQAPDLIPLIASGEMNIPQAIRETRRRVILDDLEDIASKEAREIEGVYDVVVIDPPWPMHKIERDVRPNQSELDYPTMNQEELESLKIPCAENCHIWLWATHKFLTMALHLLKTWGAKYICTFVWHKPGGFQPVGLPQYNCEFVLYARIGTPIFAETKAFNVCFDAPRGAHSEKPKEFYDMVKRVTSGRRLDMFSRRDIDGFDAWGLEA